MTGMATVAYESKQEVFAWEELSLHHSCPLKLVLSHLADVAAVTELYFGCKLCAESVALYQGEETFIDHIRTCHEEFYQEAPTSNADSINPKIELIQLPQDSQLSDSELTSEVSQMTGSQLSESQLTGTQETESQLASQISLASHDSENVILTAAGAEEVEAIEGLIRAEHEQRTDGATKAADAETEEGLSTYVVVEERPLRTRIEIQQQQSASDTEHQAVRMPRNAGNVEETGTLNIQKLEIKEEMDEISGEENPSQTQEEESESVLTMTIKPEADTSDHKDVDSIVLNTVDQPLDESNAEGKDKYGSDLDEDYEEELDFDARARPKKWSDRIPNSLEKQRVLDLIRGRKSASGSVGDSRPSHSTEGESSINTNSSETSTSGVSKFQGRRFKPTSKCGAYGRFMCRICGKFCKHRVALKEHENTHLGIKPHKCTVCNKTFTKKSNMLAHMRIHTDHKPWSCEYCGKTFREKSQCVAHTRVHSNETPWPCQYCEKSFKDKATRNKHEMIHTGEKPHICETCGMAFRYRTDLTIHVLDHEGRNPLTCQTCGKKFKKRHNYTKHLRVHTGEKNYVCTICESRFREKSHLNRHMRLHSSERPYRCDMGCDKAFPDVSSLNKHTRTHTTAYKCSVCDKTFSQKHHATRHLLIHLGNK